MAHNQSEKKPLPADTGRGTCWCAVTEVQRLALSTAEFHRETDTPMPRRTQRPDRDAGVKLRPASGKPGEVGVVGAAAEVGRDARSDRDGPVTGVGEGEAGCQARGREAVHHCVVVSDVVDEEHGLVAVVLPAETYVRIPPRLRLHIIDIFQEGVVAVGGIEFEIPARVTAEKRMAITAARASSAVLT